jgi:hypothetical protein
MSERTLKQLFGALAVVVGLWAVSFLFVGGSGAISATGAVSSILDDLDGESLLAIRLDGPLGAVDLTRGEDGWTANGHPGNQAAVSRLIDVLADAEVGDLVASNPANHDRMGVSEDSALVVTFDVDGGSRTIMVGHAGRRYGTSYVRLPDTDEVYLLEGDLRTQARRRLDDWRNRSMVKLDSAQIARIEVERAGGAYTVVRGDSLWTVEGGGEATANSVNGMLTELSDLLASGFFEESDSIAALDLETTTTAYSASGEVLAEITVGAGLGDRWARTTTDEYMYRVSSFRAGRLAPSKETIEPDGS